MKKPFALLWIFLGGILVFSWVYLPTLSKYRDLKLQQDELDKQLEKLSRDVQETREERDLLKNDVEYLEKVIRGELGLVKPGEIVYKFVQDKAVASSDSNSQVIPGPSVSPSASPSASPSPAGEIFEAKKIESPKKPVKAKISAASVPKKSAPKKKILPSAAEEPSYPRRETR